MSNRLNNKIVLITGSSGGLGKLMAKYFLERGCKLILTGSDVNKLDNTYKELGADSNTMLAIPADIRTEDHVRVLVQQAVDKFGRIDILINNAGVFKAGEITEFSTEDFELTFDVGVRGTFFATKYTAQFMKKQKAGQIINICSVGSKVGLEKLAIYCASKAALALFGDSLKVELKPYNIRVTNIFPHAINSGKKKIDDDKRRNMIEPEDVAEAVIAVASSEEYVQYQDVTIYPVSTTVTKIEK